MQGIVCANFSFSHEGWSPCRGIWHEECYECLGQGTFPIRRMYDEAGNPWHKDEKRIKELNHGMKGIHCSSAFQCEVC